MSDDVHDFKAMTTDIVSSFVTSHQVAASDLPDLIASVFAALSTAGAPAPLEALHEPAKKITPSQIRKSITPDGLSCFACGKVFKTLRRHLKAEHGQTPSDYVVTWGLPRDYPMVAESTSALRRRTAFASGLGRKRVATAAKVTPKGHR